MSSTMGTFVDRFSAIDLTSLVGQPTRTMSFVPGLLLAVAPAWYLFVGRRAPLFYHGISSLHKVTLALTALAVELHQRSARSKLYDNGADSTLIVLFSFITFWALSLTTITKGGFMVVACLDILVIADCIKAGLSIFGTGLTIHDSFLVMVSVIRATLFMIEGACWMLKSTIPRLPPHLTASGIGINSILLSPFKIATPEGPDVFGDEVRSARLWRRFNTVWFRQRHTAEPSRYVLFWTLAIMFKWELAVICAVRICLGVATLSQSHAVYRLLSTIQQSNTGLIQQCQAVLFIAFAYIGSAWLQQIFNRLMNRFLTFTHGSLDGQLLYKILRLETQDSQNAPISSLVHTDIEGLLSGIPGTLEVVASAIELGAGISSVWWYLDIAALAAFIPSICTILPSSKFFERVSAAQTALSEAVSVRVSHSKEALSNAKGIKMTGIESIICTYLNRLYSGEMRALKLFRRSQVLSMVLVIAVEKLTPLLVICSAIKWTIGREGLEPNILFPALIQLQLVVVRLQTVLFGYQRVAMMIGCHDRIQTFLLVKEYSRSHTAHRPIQISFQHALINDSALFPTREQIKQLQNSPRNNDQLQLQNATVTLPGATKPICRDVSLSLPRGELTVITGLTASGKSQFLKILLGEIRRDQGQLFIEPGMAIAYCDQKVWLRPISIKENILGGQPFNQKRYDDVIASCRLLQEFETLPQGDMTLIKKSATNLTSTQQHKAALARALYSPASIVILDDPFSCMDVLSAQQIFHSLFEENGLLKNANKTVVLATRFRKHLAYAQLAVFLDGDGHVVTRQAGDTFPEDTKLLNIIENLDDFDQPSAMPVLHNTLSKEAMQEDNVVEVNADEQQTFVAILLQHSSKSLLLSFLLITMLTSITDRATDILAGFWLQSSSTENYSIAGYIILCVVYVALNGASIDYYFQQYFPDFAKSLHNTLVRTVAKATLPYLCDANHSNTVHSLTQDITSTSRGFAMALFQTIFFSFSVTTDLVILLSVPGLAAPTTLCAVTLLYLVHKTFFPICRRLRSLDERAKSSLVTYILNASSGIEHIRAFRWLPDMMNNGLELLDNTLIPIYCVLDTKRWLDFVLQSTFAAMTVLVAVIGILKESMTSSKIGLVLFILATFSEKTTHLIRRFAQLKVDAIGVQRVFNFIDQAPSEPAEFDGANVAQKFKNSSIKIRNVTTLQGQERAGQAVAKRITLTVESGQKAAITGIDNSEKSALILSILNFLPFTGSISTGEIDISTIPCSQLRSQISVFPSDPVQLPSTIEHNLMPWRLLEEHGDVINAQTVEEVLDDVQLLSHIRETGGLQSPKKDLKLSTGQQTQFAVARLILHHLQYGNKIVIMDEPQIRLESETQNRLDQALRKYLSQSTVLMAGHNPWKNEAGVTLSAVQ